MKKIKSLLYTHLNQLWKVDCNKPGDLHLCRDHSVFWSPFDVFEGRDVFHEHVKEYKLAFSNDGSNFEVYKENGNERVMWHLNLVYPNAVSDTPLVAMPSRPPQPADLTPRKVGHEQSCTFHSIYRTEILRWVGGKVSDGKRNKSNCPPFGHMTYTQATRGVWENIFHLFRFTQPGENYPYWSGVELYLKKVTFDSYNKKYKLVALV